MKTEGWRPRVVTQAAPVLRQMGGVENESLKRLAIGGKKVKNLNLKRQKMCTEKGTRHKEWNHSFLGLSHQVTFVCFMALATTVLTR